MSKTVKIWLLVASCVLLAGIITFLLAMTSLGWDFSKLSTVKYETNTNEITEDFSSFEINSNTADIVFVASQSDKITVECFEEENRNHTVEVKDDTLKISVVEGRAWYAYVGINFNTAKITISVPSGKWESLKINSHTGKVDIPDKFSFSDVNIEQTTGDVSFSATKATSVKIKTTTGDIKIQDCSADSVDLSVSTGDITAKNVACTGDFSVVVSTGKAYIDEATCSSFTSNGSTGDVTLKNVIASNKLSVNRSTGDVTLDGVDGGEIYIKTDTGSVSGTILSPKIFTVNTSTGSKHYPSSATGGRCEIKTTTGDVWISIKE